MKRFLCVLLSTICVESLSSCGTNPLKNNTDYSGLDMPKELDFQFNTTAYGENGTVGSHDPCLIQDPISKFYYSYSTDNAVDNSKPGIGIQIRKSSDLQHWVYVGVALSQEAISQARNNGPDNPETETFWAPDVEYVDGEFHLYYAATKAFGSRESRIWLAVSQNPEGPFENKGVVVSSWVGSTNYSGPNAIDPFVINTPDGKKFLSYGSFFSGIYLKELGGDGFPLNRDRASENYFGVCIAEKGGSAIDGPEGSSILYNKDTGYYYLFVSYGWLGDTYDIRVGRSKEITGPYLDFKGNGMTDAIAGVTTGTKLACSYRFDAESPGGKQKNANSSWQWGGFRAPGGGVPFQCNGQYFFAHHIRDGAEIYHADSDGQSNYFMHYLMVRGMNFIDGWPVLSPEPYAGESQESISAEYLAGDWEMITFSEDANDQKVSQRIKLYPLGSNGEGISECGKNKGTWKYQSARNVLTVQLDSKTVVTAKVRKCWDLENSRATVCFSGLDQSGIARWGKYL